jgi:hypothetical protein
MLVIGLPPAVEMRLECVQRRHELEGVATDDDDLAVFSDRFRRQFRLFVALAIDLLEELNAEICHCKYFWITAHAESCLREELRRLGMLDSIPSQKQTLTFYLEALAKHRGVGSKIVGTFMTKRELADLKDDRNDPIGTIQSLETSLCEREHVLVQAFLCCTLARNYFAHHDFLDHELLHTSSSEFLMQGIILTVLTLLDAE